MGFIPGVDATRVYATDKDGRFGWLVCEHPEQPEDGGEYWHLMGCRACAVWLDTRAKRTKAAREAARSGTE